MNQAAAVPTLPARDHFEIPAGIYLDGNSLGPLPKASRRAIEETLNAWASHGVASWSHWFTMAESLSASVARLVGAHEDEVIATGSITSNLHALLATFPPSDDRRRTWVATSLDFPSDLYALRSWVDRWGGTLRLVPSRDGYTIHDDDLDAAIDDTVTFVWLPTVLYRSGQALDVRRWTHVARERGAIVGWDAAHSVGAMPHTFHEDGVDVATWCTYKYVNAGPGAPGGLFVHRRHHDRTPGLAGWWGHDKATQFEMAPTFRKAHGAGAYQLGTPPIVALAGLRGALDLFDAVGIDAVRARSLRLTDALRTAIERVIPEARVVTPYHPDRRGGHVAIAIDHAHALSLALRERGVVLDFRPPDILRMAPVATFTTDDEVERAVTTLREILDDRTFERFDVRDASPVT